MGIGDRRLGSSDKDLSLRPERSVGKQSHRFWFSTQQFDSNGCGLVTDAMDIYFSLIYRNQELSDKDLSLRPERSVGKQSQIFWFSTQQFGCN
ncbi:hypothetical protein BC008_28660 [Mastigocoleus testarum BC008]|uniref:Uncharacterized protein n=2 Tax=Mastigocoleus TaxID=996924 RepID=A0A0V7ZR94_9CYAN|nr:hypothetical protein BC008_27520 [Mastigocoleus testarum BC008]KST67168.1 hypothetical protein BC008_28660 [Mastigocoleus testarum BC008]